MRVRSYWFVDLHATERCQRHRNDKAVAAGISSSLAKTPAMDPELRSLSMHHVTAYSNHRYVAARTTKTPVPESHTSSTKQSVWTHRSVQPGTTVRWSRCASLGLGLRRLHDDTGRTCHESTVLCISSLGRALFLVFHAGWKLGSFCQLDCRLDQSAWAGTFCTAVPNTSCKTLTTCEHLLPVMQIAFVAGNTYTFVQLLSAMLFLATQDSPAGAVQFTIPSALAMEW